MCFIIFYDETTPFYDIKTRSSEYRKIEIFSKVSPWFWSKIGHFSNFFFICQYRPAKCLLSYSRTKKRLSSLKKQEVQTVKKWSFFQRGYSIVLVQNWPFFQFFFICQYRPEKCVLSYSRRKKPLSWHKKHEVKKIKKLRFSQRG